jgi:hypothetical protein
MDLIFVDLHGLIWVFSFQMLRMHEKLFFTFLLVGANPTPLNNNYRRTLVNFLWILITGENFKIYAGII